MVQQYKDPANGVPSSVGPQIITSYFLRQALTELRKEQYFTQLAHAQSIPANFGKELKRYHYMPILDDRNVNDEGIDATGAKIVNGNLYGSSRDIGTVPGKLPLLGENGGRVNRVGVTRIELSGTFEKFGFFTEYTRDSMNFDSDADLLMHINRELLTAANQITEDALGIDIINNAGTIRYAGDATSRATIGQNDVVTYVDLMRLAIDLDNNRTPKHTTIMTGTRNIDTRVIPATIPAQTVPPVNMQAPKKDPVLAKKSAAAPRQTVQGKKTISEDVNLFALSDEEFAKIDPSQFK